MRFIREIEIDAPADKAWEVLGEGFGEISNWTSSLSGELDVGGIRTCESSKSFGPFKGGATQERLIAYDPLSMTLEYEAISGLSGFVRRAGNRWSVHKVDEGHCIVRFTATLELRGIFMLPSPVMGLLTKSPVDALFEEL